MVGLWHTDGHVRHARRACARRWQVAATQSGWAGFVILYVKICRVAAISTRTYAGGARSIRSTTSRGTHKGGVRVADSYVHASQCIVLGLIRGN
jgi:hypothetical protein